MVFRAYSGTTDLNYLRCAIPLWRDLVLFDKLREPRHDHSRMFFSADLFEASAYAIGTARTINRKLARRRIDVEHKPVILSGVLPDWLGGTSRLMPEELPFPVDRLLLALPTWKDYSAEPGFPFGMPQDYFREASLSEVNLSLPQLVCR